MLYCYEFHSLCLVEVVPLLLSNHEEYSFLRSPQNNRPIPLICFSNSSLSPLVSFENKSSTEKEQILTPWISSHAELLFHMREDNTVRWSHPVKNPLFVDVWH